jgi:hypothetical protein
MKGFLDTGKLTDAHFLCTSSVKKEERRVVVRLQPRKVESG